MLSAVLRSRMPAGPGWRIRPRTWLPHRQDAETAFQVARSADDEQASCAVRRLRGTFTTTVTANAASDRAAPTVDQGCRFAPVNHGAASTHNDPIAAAANTDPNTGRWASWLILCIAANAGAGAPAARAGITSAENAR